MLTRNKLRRQQGMIGGVCGGLGAFFGMDPWVFRIVFILLALLPPAAALPYAILWVIIPKAR